MPHEANELAARRLLGGPRNICGGARHRNAPRQAALSQKPPIIVPGPFRTELISVGDISVTLWMVTPGQSPNVATSAAYMVGSGSIAPFGFPCAPVRIS